MTASTLLHVLLFGLIVYLQPYLPVLSHVDAEPVVTMVEVAKDEPQPSVEEREPAVEEADQKPETAVDTASGEDGVEASGDEEASNDTSTDEGNGDEGENAESGSEPNGGDSEESPAVEKPGDASPPPEPERGNPPSAGTGEQRPLGGGTEDGAETPSGTEPTPEAGVRAGATEPPAGGGAPDLAPNLASDVSVYGTALTETVTIPDGDDVRVVPGVGEGIPATLEENRYDWNGYIQSMLVLLDRAITPRLPSRIDPRTDDPIVSVVVMRDGTVRSVKMVRSSGVQEIDDAVLAGLSTRMPELPEKWPAKAARIPLLFRLPGR